MKLPCELIIWYILPAVRKEVAMSLIRDHGLKQAQVARKLGVSEATVSHYVSRKRARFSIEDGKILEQVKRAADMIMNGEEDVMVGEICRICETIKKSGILSGLYEKHTGRPSPIDHCSSSIGC